MSGGQFRLRVRYRKAGRLRFLSHLELIRALERIIRRADLPYAVSQGFSPHMKVAFGPALPVGSGGDDEYLDVTLVRYIAPSAVFEKLLAVSPTDLAPVEVAYVSDSERSLAAALTLGEYRIVLQGDDAFAQMLDDGIERTMETGTVRVEQKGKEKVYDLAKALWKKPEVKVEEGRVVVQLAIRTSNEGSLRPETYLRSALETHAGDLSVVSITRVSQAVEEKDGTQRRPL